MRALQFALFSLAISVGSQDASARDWHELLQRVVEIHSGGDATKAAALLHESTVQAEAAVAVAGEEDRSSSSRGVGGGTSGSAPLTPPPAGAWMILGQLQTELKQYDQSIATISRAIAAFGGARHAPADALYTMGAVHSASDNYAEAMRWYSLAVSKNDQHALSWTYLGMLAAREGDYARAKDGLDRALALAASQNAESTRQIVTQALEMLDLQEAEIEAAAELEGMGNRVGGECNRGGQEEEEEEEEEEDHDVDGTSGNEDPKVAGEAVNMLLEESACIPLATRAVDRVPASSLTVEQFRERYVWEGLPVVITGDVAAGHAAKKWSPAEIVQHCRADVTATVNRRGAGKWAGQLPHHSVRLADFLAPLRGAGAAKGNAEQSREPKGNGTDYLFDFNLPTMCPALMEQFKMPAYVAQDLLQRTPAGTKYREYWPSLFAGKGGSTGAEMHVDAWCSHFWMVMLSGSKRWTLFSEEDSLRLGRNYFTAGFQINSTSFRHSNDHAQDHAQDGSRGVEPSVCIRASAVRARPMAAALMPLVATLNPGDLLFVPAETPHYVENLSGMHPARNSNRNDDWVTMAISGNFLDESNFECAVDALERLAITDPQTAALVKMLQSPYFDSTIYEPAGNVTGGVPWQLYKEGAF